MRYFLCIFRSFRFCGLIRLLLPLMIERFKIHRIQYNRMKPSTGNNIRHHFTQVGKENRRARQYPAPGPGRSLAHGGSEKRPPAAPPPET